MPAGARHVSFRFAGPDIETPIGVLGAPGATYVLPDGSLRAADERISFRQADGRPLTADATVRQSALDGYLPMVVSDTRVGGVPVALTAFAVDLPGVGTCDVVRVAAGPSRGGPGPLVLRAEMTAGDGLRAEGARLTSDGRVRLAGLPGEGHPELAAEVEGRAAGHFGEYHGVGTFWPRPEGQYSPVFATMCIGWRSQPMTYRFRVEPGGSYVVAVGFWEWHWKERGHRLVETTIDGQAGGVVDTVSAGTGHPVVAQYAAHDADGNGLLDVTVAAARSAPDQNSILNVIWLFPAGSPPDGDALLRGDLDREALAMVDCGSLSDRPFSDAAIRLSLPVAPGRPTTAWVVRPRDATRETASQLPGELDDGLIDRARQVWEAMLRDAVIPDLPHPVATDFYRASLAQILLQPDRPGPTAANALTYAGLFGHAERRLACCLDRQRGNTPSHEAAAQWDGPGQAIWAFATHARLSGNWDFMARAYPDLMREVRQIAASRARSKRLDAQGERPPTYGLLLLGTDDSDAPSAARYAHDFWTLYGIELVLSGARALGRTSDVAWLEAEREDFSSCLTESVARSFVELPDGQGYIPSTPGSQEDAALWGNLAALYPTRFLLGDSRMARTMALLGSRQAEGLPAGPGSASGGMAPRIACDVARCHMLLGEYDKAAELLYAILDHASPTRCWMEAETAAAYISMLRDMVAFEDGGTLRLASAVPRDWLLDGQSIAVRDLPTAVGRVSFRLRSDATQGRMSADVRAPRGTPVVLHLRHPGLWRLTSVKLNGREWADHGTDWVRFAASGTPTRVEARFEE
ncbi:MAG TPA: hypothetical protein PLQ54_00935 [Armatimonadota bacterium]|nr:hypothetical protein [Armatimonadota bacterium]